MGESLLEQCHLKVEGLRVMNFFSRRRSNDVRRQIPGLNPGQAVETTKLEYGRGRGNFRWSGKMHRDQKEHQRRKHSVEPTLTLRDERLDMSRILLKERGAFGNANTGGAWLSSAHIVSDKSKEGEDDVKSSRPLCPGRHRLQLACMKPESLVIAGQPYSGEFVLEPCTHRPSHYGSFPCPKRIDGAIQGPGDLKKDLRVSRVGLGGFLNAFFFLLIGVISQRLAMVRKKRGTSTLRERSTTESCMLRSGRMHCEKESIDSLPIGWTVCAMIYFTGEVSGSSLGD
ncbi:hypothetical protein E5676_scaffold371G00380 [Cucumis melo var. makuwa]|uniref:Uncharacterized protein n=2 Tax=Cucumis melo TaxID=3656 RepID=A0A5D3BBA8_CUCMM|nr:hypothetical protein E6C27_scaffold153G00440 [Cucumis melo var. makuwa]TYJ97122.1 hypothetical protein E5676_scaffold371G00380 [Cucumis melo var. makuwa]